jgi:hypothetical protein
MMRAYTLFRACAVIFVLFALGHTFGFLRFKPATPEGLAVKTAMDAVRFPFGNATRTYGELYRGFGLFVTAYLLFSALFAWKLPSILASSPETYRVLAGGFLAVQIASAALSWIYFALPPAVLSSAVVLCLAWGMLLARSA